MEVENSDRMKEVKKKEVEREGLKQRERGKERGGGRVGTREREDEKDWE